MRVLLQRKYRQTSDRSKQGDGCPRRHLAGGCVSKPSFTRTSTAERIELYSALSSSALLIELATILCPLFFAFTLQSRIPEHGVDKHDNHRVDKHLRTTAFQSVLYVLYHSCHSACRLYSLDVQVSSARQ